MEVPLASTQGGEISLEVIAAADSYAADDRAVLPLELPRLVKVLVIDGDPQTVRHRDEVFYLERALGADARGRGRLASQVVNAESASAQDVMGADVVVLANVSSIASEVARALVTRVRGGGGLLITAGDKLDPDFYNGALADLLPSPLRGAKSSAPLDDPAAREILSLEVLTRTHPIFARLGPGAENGLGQVRTHTLLLIDPGRPGERTDLLRFSNGAPALIERRVDSGRVLLLCTSIDRDWSDLAIRPGFLPLVQQLALYLANAIEVPRPRSFTVGATVSLRPPQGARALLVTDPEGEEHRVDLLEGRPARFAATVVLGLHRVAADLGAGSPRPLPAERFAVAVDPRESDTRLLDLEGLRARLPSGVGLSQGGGGPKRERPLWPFLLAALALLALGEAAAARRG